MVRINSEFIRAGARPKHCLAKVLCGMLVLISTRSVSDELVCEPMPEYLAKIERSTRDDYERIKLTVPSKVGPFVFSHAYMSLEIKRKEICPPCRGPEVFWTDDIEPQPSLMSDAEKWKSMTFIVHPGIFNVHVTFIYESDMCVSHLEVLIE